MRGEVEIKHRNPIKKCSKQLGEIIFGAKSLPFPSLLTMPGQWQ